MIRRHLLPLIRQRYPGVQWVFGEPPDPIAQLKSDHSEVGELHIYDDGDEVTVCITEITHGHFNPYDELEDDKERDQWIVNEVIEFLDALFEERVLLYRSPNRRSSGWTVFNDHIDERQLREELEYFTWSGPITRRE